MTNSPQSFGLGPALADGDWEGWSTWTGSEPFEEHVGPFYAKRDDKGQMIAGCRVLPHNLNGAGSIHGGSLMAFADYSLFMIAYDETRDIPAVTVTLQGEFLASTKLGARLVNRGEVLKSGGSLVFVRGTTEADGRPIFSFSGVLKLVRPRG
ncbi:MAG: PaaI family thioesterase [Hyphomonadaceae bacterium]